MEDTCSIGMLVAILVALSSLQVSSAQVYSLQIGVNGNLSNSPAVHVSRDLIGETVSLVCISIGCAADAQLEWLDGRVPLRQLPANVELERSGEHCTTTLRFHNFSVENYGQYRCRCLKQLSLSPLLSANRHLSFNDMGMLSSDSVFCSDQTVDHVITLWPRSDKDVAIEEKYVVRSGDSHSLQCDSGEWIITNQSLPDRAVFDQQRTYNITIRESVDQSKLLCLHSNGTLDKIFYVSIENYQQVPFEFVRPHTDGGVVVVDLDQISLQWPVLCVLQKSSGESGTMSIYINGVKYSQNRNFNIGNEIIGLWSNALPDTKNLNYFALITVGVTMFSEAYSYNFSCRGRSYWEEDAMVNFTLIMPPPVTSPPLSHTATTTTTTTAHSTPQTSSPPSSLSPVVTPALTSSPPSYLLPSTPSYLPPSSLGEDSQTEPQLGEPTENSNKDNSNVTVFIVAGLTSALIIAIVILLVVYICFRKYCRLSDRYRLTGLMAKEMFLELGVDLQSSEAQSVDREESPAGGSSKQLVKCLAELEDKQWLFPYDQLEIGEDLGSGAFGVVKKAVAHNVRADGSSIVVAVKMLKENSYDDDKKDLISELKVLQHVGAHPNIVSFLGAAIHQGNLHVIVEFCGRGSLLHYLRSKRSDQNDPLTPKILLSIAHQVSQGMKHLVAKKCIHRDLAARNVLVTQDLTFKVADFGLARKVYDSVYRPSGGRVPIKWMALETILDREYTIQSDVWSFGILLWEIMSLGRSPYPGKSPEEVIKCIGNGFRMPAPDSCPHSIYSLMMWCWDKVPSGRPSFPELCVITEELGRELQTVDSGITSCSCEEHHFDDTLSSVTSELCCYCAAEAEGGKYCRCSASSLSLAGGAGMPQNGYVNTSLRGDEETDESGVELEGAKYCQCSVSSVPLGQAVEGPGYVNTNLSDDEEEEEEEVREGGTIACPVSTSLRDEVEEVGSASQDSNVNASLPLRDTEKQDNGGSGEARARDLTLSKLRHSLVIPTTSSLPPLIHGSSELYLPVVWGSSDYLPLLKASAPSDGNGGESLNTDTQSLCSVCKVSCRTVAEAAKDQHKVHQPKSLRRADSSSLQSICSHCKEDVPSLSTTDQRPLHHRQRAKETPNSLPLHLKLSLEQGKARVEHQASNDSGVMTMSSETPSVLDVWSQKSSVSEAVSDLDEVVTCLEVEGCGHCDGGSEETFWNDVAGLQRQRVREGARTAGQRTQLSAHPRFRALFDKLGIVESDV